MTKKEILNQLEKPPCEFGQEITCPECALRFTFSCEINEEDTKTRREMYKLIKANTRGLDFNSLERCQITVLKAELKAKRKWEH